MTETTPAPAERAVKQSSTSALADDQVAPTYFVPQATQDNYAQIARDQAGVRGVEPRQVMQELADQFDRLHERQPLDGYDHLAAWAREFDPSVGSGPTGLAVLQARALESARRDPYQAVVGDQALVEQGVTAQRAADEGLLGVTGAPSVTGDAGMLPNAGPLTVPADTTSGDPAVAEQQQAARQQLQDQQQSAPAPAPAPTPEPTPAPKSSGGGHGKSSGGSGS